MTMMVLANVLFLGGLLCIVGAAALLTPILGLFVLGLFLTFLGLAAAKP